MGATLAAVRAAARPTDPVFHARPGGGRHVGRRGTPRRTRRERGRRGGRRRRLPPAKTPGRGRGGRRPTRRLRRADRRGLGRAGPRPVPVNEPALRRRHTARWVAGSALVIGVALVVLLATRPPQAATEAYSPLVGHPAPAIVGTTVGGSSFGLDSAAGAVGGGQLLRQLVSPVPAGGARPRDVRLRAPGPDRRRARRRGVRRRRVRARAASSRGPGRHGRRSSTPADRSPSTTACAGRPRRSSWRRTASSPPASSDP